MEMQCLDLIQEAATRIGIVPPSTIENVSNPDPSKRNPDAMILLGALNETMRQALVKNLFDPFCVMVKVVLTGADNVPNAGNTYIFPIRTKLPDFGGLLSSYFEVEYGNGVLQTFFETDPDTFLKFWKEPMSTGTKPMPQKNIFRIYNNKVSFIAREAFTPTSLFSNIGFSYRSTFGVMLPDKTTTANSFKYDADTSTVDDELLIAGTVLNYKAYQGMEYQFDAQKYSAYLDALEKNRQNNNTIRDNSLKMGVSE
jgi:hypothetical protein